MSNPYYNTTGSPSTGSTGSSSVMRAEFAAIMAAFDKLPALTAASPVFVNAGGTALEAANLATAQNRLGIVSSNELNGLANLNAVGIVARTGNGAYTNRTLTGTANQVTVTNGNGNAGNPTVSLPNPLNVNNLGVTNLNVSSLVNGIPPNFTSAETSLAAGRNDISHGLGVTPSLYHVVLRCKSNDFNWVVGDEVFVGAGPDGITSMVPAANNSSISLIINTFSIINKNSGAAGGTANINAWKAVARVWI